MSITIDLQGDSRDNFQATVTGGNRTATAPGLTPFDAYAGALRPILPPEAREGRR